MRKRYGNVKSKYQQIGNAVAPRMAFRIADQLKMLLFASDTLSPRMLPESSELNVNQPVTNQKPDLMAKMQFLDAAE